MTRTITTPEERFWSKVDWGSPEECWPWTGGCTKQGYGGFHPTKGETVQAHRYAYELLVGPIPDGLVGDHVCHNDSGCAGGPTCPHKKCCNPLHLEPKTIGQNVAASHLSNGHKTHCPQGHEYTPQNTRIQVKATTRSRKCRRCERGED